MDTARFTDENWLVGVIQEPSDRYAVFLPNPDSLSSGVGRKVAIIDWRRVEASREIATIVPFRPQRRPQRRLPELGRGVNGERNPKFFQQVVDLGIRSHSV